MDNVEKIKEMLDAMQVEFRRNQQQQLQQRKPWTEEDVKQMKNNVVKLNIGGTRFETTAMTLRSVPHSFFDLVLEGSLEAVRQEDGSIFVDRDPKYFSFILNFLRNPDDKVILPEQEYKKKLIMREAEFYRITAFVATLKEGKTASFTWSHNIVSTNFPFQYEISNHSQTLTKVQENSTMTIAQCNESFLDQAKTVVRVMVQTKGSDAHVGIGPINEKANLCWLKVDPFVGITTGGVFVQGKERQGLKIANGDTVTLEVRRDGFSYSVAFGLNGDPVEQHCDINCGEELFLLGALRGGGATLTIVT